MIYSLGCWYLSRRLINQRKERVPGSNQRKDPAPRKEERSSSTKDNSNISLKATKEIGSTNLHLSETITRCPPRARRLLALAASKLKCQRRKAMMIPLNHPLKTKRPLMIQRGLLSTAMYRKYHSAKLQNTGPLICMSLNKNSIYCVVEGEVELSDDTGLDLLFFWPNFFFHAAYCFSDISIDRFHVTSSGTKIQN